jgi:hypothetical protein
MARERARRDEDEPRQPRRPAQKSTGGMFGLALVLFVLALVLVLYAMRAERPAPEPAKVESVDPFADLPPEPPPEKQAKTKGQLAKEQAK